MNMKQILCSLLLLSLIPGCGKGEPGANGTPGMTLTNHRYCSSTASGLTFTYRLLKYSTGDVYVTCAVHDSSATFSNSAMYLSGQGGATAGGCTLVYDVDTSSSGYWKFETSGSSSLLTYTDPGSTRDGTTHTYTADECVDSP